MWNKVEIIKSTDNDVQKYVFSNDTAVAEAVLYKYGSYEERTVICCSTQSGCPMGCRFCGAGDYFVRSLTADEIVGQVRRLIEDAGCISENLQIMFMSMGEPLLNRSGLENAIKMLHTYYPHGRLLISTSAPRVNYDWVRHVSVLVPTVGLQFSVHETTDEARNKLIPFKNKLTLQEIAFEGVLWAGETGRRPFFNYCVHGGNDTQADAERLYSLFSPSTWEATLSVICERDEHIAAANERQRALAEEFKDRLVKLGYSTRVFNPAGQDDIGGGCGQLWFVQQWMKEHGDLARPSTGCGKEKVHTPC
jgi:23S rRNA (adenine2503-C2)-methyltransferase